MKKVFCIAALLWNAYALNAQNLDSLQQNLFFEWDEDCPPYHVDIYNYLAGDEKYTYSWFVNADSLTGGNSPDFVIADSGWYDLRCVVYDGPEIIYRDTFTLGFFCEPGGVYADAVYNCGQPDFVVAQSEGYSIESIILLNRWGQVIFESEGIPLEPWYFEYANGGRLESGTYVSLVKFKDPNNNPRIQVSHLSLFY